MKKSLVAVMLGLMMTVSLVGCGGCGTEVVEEETTEVVEEPTEVVEEVAEEEPTEVAEEVVEEPATEEVAEETPAVEEVSPYSYTELNQVMYAQSTVNVRDLPEQTGGKLGGLTTNQEVTVTGQCNETGWYRISYNGGEGFVSNSYLGTEKVAVSTGTASQSSQPEAPAPSVPEESTVSEPANDTAETPEEIMADVDAGLLTPDNFHCPICGFDATNPDEAHAHLRDVHGMQV